MEQTERPRRHVADVIFEAAQRAASSRAKEVQANLPALSLYTFVSSLMMVGSRVRKLGHVELGIAEIMSWQRPEMTFSLLIMYSVLCYQPQWLILLPLFYFVAGVLIPNYALKFKIDTNGMLTVKGEAESKRLAVLSAPQKEEDQEKRDRSMLVGIRQGQKTLGDILKALDKVDEFRNGPAKFADPQVSCIMLMAATSALLVSAYALTFISIPALFSSAAWIAVLSKHPLVKLGQKKLENIHIESSIDPQKVLQVVTDFGHKHVLMDDETLKRSVEIFELQPQGLTSFQWRSDTSIYSTSPYASNYPPRQAKNRPEGTDNLSDVLPPEDWYFDIQDDWESDPNALSWVARFGVQQVEIDGMWAYDVGVEQRWRRRRLIRLCYYEF